MGCSRCGNNRGNQIPLAPSQPAQPVQRPGSNPRPVQPVRVNPSDSVRNAIGNLRYVPK